jgi:hypothetical protein
VPRYAILNDLDTPDLHPVGLAIELLDRVQLLLVDDYGLRSEFREPYTVREPDGEKVVYQPGRTEYFDHVLLTLSRGFLVSHVGAIEELDSLTVAKLFHDEINAKQPRPRPGEYALRQGPQMRPTPRVAAPNASGAKRHGSPRRTGPIRIAA